MKTRSLKNIVIAGAGPIGLYIAIMLHQIIKSRGLKTQVTVIDSRAGKYNRPGVIANQALQLLEQGLGIQINDVKKPTPNSMLIQDLELSLYKKAVKMGILFINSSFHAFDAGKVIVDNENSPLLACDLAIDCTGQIRALVNYVNKENNGKPFTISRMNENPLKNHFVAYITMDKHNAALAKADNNDNLQFVLALEKLRNQFGWTEFAMPTIDTGQWRSFEDAEKIFTYYYFEIPANLPKDQQEVWLKSLLRLKSGNDIQFKAEQGLKFTPFIVDPHQVTPASYTPSDQTMPMVIACGDAQIAPDYRKGHGIESGINRANAFISSLKMTAEHELIINVNQYEALLRKPIGIHVDLIETTYRHRKSELAAATTNAKEKYLQALTETNDPEEKQIIICGLNAIHCKLIYKNYEALSTINQNSEQAGLYQMAIKEEENALQKIKIELVDDKPMANSVLLDLAKNYKLLAGQLFAAPNHLAAKKYYNYALKIFADHFKQSHGDEIIKIYSNLSILENKSKNYDGGLQNATLALDLLNTSTNIRIEDKKLITKIKFNKCLALIETVTQQEKKHSAANAKNKIAEVQKLFKEIKEEGIDKKSIDLLNSKLSPLETMYSKESKKHTL